VPGRIRAFGTEAPAGLLATQVRACGQFSRGIARFAAPGITWKLRFNPRCILERQMTVPVVAS